MKKIILLFCLIFFGLPSLVSAELNVTSATDWLFSEMDEVEWNKDTDEVALSVLALRNFGYDVSEGIEKLKSTRNVDNWEGNVYYTSLASLALSKFGENVSDEIDWLLVNRYPAMQDGDWLIQVRFTGGTQQSTCSVDYEGTSTIFELNGTEIVGGPGCIGEHWINFESCVKGSAADVYESFSIDCVGASFSPSLLFKKYIGDYYLTNSGSNLLELENGCFSAGGACSCAYTGYASFVLNELGENAATLPFLDSSCSDDALGNSFLLLMTSGSEYSDWLTENQLGSNWDNSEYTTALSIHALRSSNLGSSQLVSDSKDWLGLHQLSGGSWDDSVKTTSMVLWGAFSDKVPVPIPVEGSCNNGILEGNETCEIGVSCTGDLTCIDCQCVTVQTCNETDECRSDVDCTQTGYTCNPNSCSCEIISFECTSDNQCDSGEYCDLATHTCQITPVAPSGCNLDSDCDDGEFCNITSGHCTLSEGGLGWLAWFIAIIVIAGGSFAGYWAYKNKKFNLFKPKGPQPSSGFPAPKRELPKPSYPVARQAITRPNVRKYIPNRKDSRLEKELDDSIKKAKDLLKEKKK